MSLLLATYMSPVQSEVTLTLDLFYSDFNLDRDEISFTELAQDADLIGIEAAIVYPLTTHLRSRFGIGLSSTLDILGDTFDQVNLIEYFVDVGYAFTIGGALTVLPHIGIAYLDLDIAEGRFLNPGDEANGEFSDTDYFAGIKFSINQFYLNVRHTAFKYGELSSFAFGYEFRF